MLSHDRVKPLSRVTYAIAHAQETCESPHCCDGSPRHPFGVIQRAAAAFNGGMPDFRRGRLGTSLLIGLTALLLASCSGGPGSGGIIEGTEWILRSYAAGEELLLVPETEYADAEFDRHRVTGVSGCNQYDALYRTGTRSLLVSQPASTLLACDEESMAFEQAYLADLQQSRFYTVRRETLTIFGSKGATLLVFDASPRNPLLGNWDVDSFASGNSVTAPPEGVRLEVVFGLASVGGFSGCNTFSGTYGTNGNYVRISPLASTRIACDEETMAVETAFLQALQGTSFLDRQGQVMLLNDRQGSLRRRAQAPAARVGADGESERRADRGGESDRGAGADQDRRAHEDAGADDRPDGEPGPDHRAHACAERAADHRAHGLDLRPARGGRRARDA